MSTSPLTWTRIDKAAHDNGFDLEGPRLDAWRTYTSSQTDLRIWICSTTNAEFVLAVSNRAVFSIAGLEGTPHTGPLPPGAQDARRVLDIPALNDLIRRTFRLFRALPDAPLEIFFAKTATMPTTTEAERLVVQRIGHDVFRNSLIDYWDGRCPLSGLAVVELLRASHIKPWADCDSDAERLDAFNGLLLAPHLDAAFDRGFMTLDDEGRAICADALDASARAALGLNGPLRAATLTDAHRAYLDWHRERVFRNRGSA